MTAPIEQTSSESEAKKLRKRLALGALGAGVMALLGLVAWQLPWAPPVTFDQGVELVSARVSREASRSQDVFVTLSFRAQGPLDRDYLLFAHLGGAAAHCATSVDTTPAVPTSRWKAGETYTEALQIPLPRGCEPGAADVLTGLFHRGSGARLRVLTPENNTDNRVQVGSLEVVAGAAGPEQRTLEGRAFARRVMLAPLLPWLSWIAGLAAACLALFLARGRMDLAQVAEPAALASGSEKQKPRRAAKLWLAASYALPMALFLTGMLMVLEFIKDDAYISFRYAYNLVHGHGLVFNDGERLEGITNFLWTLLLAPFEALGLDLFQVCEVLGAGLCLLCLLCVARLTAFVQDGRGVLGSASWGALWLASSSSFVLYANSGLEQPLAALLPVAGALVLYQHRALNQQGEPSAKIVRGYGLAGLLLGAGCLTRPELHLSAVLVALPAVWDTLRARRLGRPEQSLVLGVLALTVPAHLFRFFYYGTLIPNTFYVKTSNDTSVLKQGLDTLQDMFAFNHTGLLLMLAPLAFLERRRTPEKVACMLISVSFLAYYARVGVDEMHWHRLYIPALPFACVLAASGAQNLLSLLRAAFRLGERSQLALSLLGWAGVLLWVYTDMRVTYDAEHGFDGHGDFAGTYHPDMGKFLVRHERPGGLVAFQDMGSTPYHAPDLSFLDFFGLVDKTVAHARHAHGLHAFIHDNPRAQREYDAEMRDYFFRRNPEWTILTIYAHGADRKPVAEAFAKDPTGAAFGNYYRNNPVQFGLWDDTRFRSRYVPVRTWARSSAYYLALWRRRDLWQQTPGEVVFDAGRAGQQPLAVFEGGLELLDAEVSREVLEHHEAFVTSHWRLPGPMAPDLMFFLHFVRGSSQFPEDHIPGDWMYPADRWKQAQILEDRTLVQLPPGAMDAGDYVVYLGAYRRETGERLRVTQGMQDPSGRVRIGTLSVKPLVPLLHALIPRTYPAEMRAHPERIVQAGAQVVGIVP